MGELVQRISHLNGLKCKGRCKFANGHYDLILQKIFFILISLNTKVPLILHTKFQPNIPCHFGEMDLNARVDVNFVRVDVNFQTVTVTLFRYRYFFIVLISINIRVLRIRHTKIQPNIPSRSGENADFIGFAIFSTCGQLEFSTRLNFTIWKPWSLIMLHVKFEIHWCNG